MLLLTAPAQATVEDCRRALADLSKLVSGAAELRLGPTATPDGWCRVIDGPFGAGLEWQIETSGAQFDAAFRQERLELDDLGFFNLTGNVAFSDEARLMIGPIRLETRAGDTAILQAVSSPNSDFRASALSAGLERASLTVSGERGLVSEVLAWAFRLDLAAAQSSFIAARDQREEMLSWLSENAESALDPGSVSAFRRMVEAYPSTRGTAQIAMREDRPVQIGGLLSAVLFGTSLTRGEAGKLIEEAGLRFTWTPG